MVGRDEPFHGAAPGSRLYAADVYCGLPTGGAVDAIAAAFGWLVSQQVPVINVSLVGPRNTTLEAVVPSFTLFVFEGMGCSGSQPALSALESA